MLTKDTESGSKPNSPVLEGTAVATESTESASETLLILLVGNGEQYLSL